jgi:hypothetical protein
MPTGVIIASKGSSKSLDTMTLLYARARVKYRFYILKYAG